MRVLDPGHAYELRHLDGTGVSVLVFVKREGPGYPGNVGHHQGTNLQEVIRALINRVQYLDGQIHHGRNDEVIWLLRVALVELELRAAERHQREFMPFEGEIEEQPTCLQCGHVQCSGSCEAHALRKGVPAVESGVRDSRVRATRVKDSPLPEPPT
jgi:hypothetical protein